MHDCERHDITDAAMRRDPTGTTPISRAFERDALVRFKKFRGLTRRLIVDMDVLGLANVTADSLDFVKLYGGEGHDGEKVRAFTAWLRQAGASVIVGDQQWAAPYVAQAYGKGINDAERRLNTAKRAVAARGAMHAHSLGLIQTRTHESLVNVRDTMIQQMSRMLANALLASRVDPPALARDLLSRVDAIGITRARLVASYETVAAYSESTINVYEDGGIRRVGVIPEYQARPRRFTRDDPSEISYKGLKPDTPRPDYGPGIYKRGANRNTPRPTDKWPRGRWPMVAWATAGDELVCPQCEALEDQIFTLETARGMLPLHPNCRCALYPLVEVDEDEEDA